MVEERAVYFKLKCKIPWDFVDVTQQLFIVRTGDAYKAMDAVSDLRRALVDANRHLFVNLLGPRVINVGLVVYADQDGVLPREKIVRPSLANDRILLGLQYLRVSGYLLGKVEYLVVVA